MAYSKYKDAPPEETIKRIKECFSKVGIDLKHKVSKRMDGIYSSVVLDGRLPERELPKNFAWQAVMQRQWNIFVIIALMIGKRLMKRAEFIWDLTDIQMKQLQG
jgi:hypothetical protein